MAGRARRSVDIQTNPRPDRPHGAANSTPRGVADVATRRGCGGPKSPAATSSLQRTTGVWRRRDPKAPITLARRPPGGWQIRSINNTIRSAPRLTRIPLSHRAAKPVELQYRSRPEQELNTGDSAWMLISTALVLFMLPGLALFYGGLVAEKNVINIMAETFVAIGLTTYRLFFSVLGSSGSDGSASMPVVPAARESSRATHWSTHNWARPPE
jgi:hypothetical protein